MTDTKTSRVSVYRSRNGGNLVIGWEGRDYLVLDPTEARDLHRQLGELLEADTVQCVDLSAN